MTTTAHVHFVIGPVGAGKSTFARHLCRDHLAIEFDVDDWMARLFGRDERPATGRLEWYVERRDRCIEQIWQLARRIADAGVPVVLEIGMIQRADRAAFYQRADDAGYSVTVYVLDAPRDERRARVVRRNADQGDTFSMHVPPEVFELASDMWEPPDDEEVAARGVIPVVDVTDESGRPAYVYRTDAD